MATVENGKAGAEERVIAATRRPDGSLRKEIRIRAGYTPQDEVAIYQPKGAQVKKGTDVPPGYDPASASKPKTKAAKKNEKRKEKKQQQQQQSATTVTSDATSSEDLNVSTSQESTVKDDTKTLSQQLSTLKVTTKPETKQETLPEEDASAKVELEKRIRALRKKIRLAESKITPVSGSAVSVEQADKIAKLETLRQELQGLEASQAAA